MLSGLLESLMISANAKSTSQASTSVSTTSATSASQTSTSVSTANASSISQTLTGLNGELPTPDNEYRATSANQTFIGVNGEVDYFIFNTKTGDGHYVVDNYEPDLEWLIFLADPGDSVDVYASNDHVTYTNITASTDENVDDHAVGEATGISIATITGDLLFG